MKKEYKSITCLRNIFIQMNHIIIFLILTALLILPTVTIFSNVEAQIIDEWNPETDESGSSESENTVLISEGSNYFELKSGEEIEIPDYATIKVTEFKFTDKIYSHRAGYKPSEGDIFRFFNNEFEYGYESGEDSEFAIIYAEITNLDTNEKDFLKDCEVTGVYSDKYIYEGQGIQFNYDITNVHVDAPTQEVALHPDDVFAIKPLYSGHYGFFSQVPNLVVENKEKLKIEIKIDNYTLEFDLSEKV